MIDPLNEYENTVWLSDSNTDVSFTVTGLK